MSAGVARATVRVSVVGEAGRVDLVVPLGTDVTSLGKAYADAVGATTVPRLSTVAGVPLDGQLPVDDVRLADGHVVLATDAGTAPANGFDATKVPHDQGVRRAAHGHRIVAVLAAACSAAGAALLAFSDAQRPAHTAIVVVLLVCAVLCALPFARRQAAVSPLLGASAGFAATYRHAPGGLLLGLAVAAFCAAVLAAFSRIFLDTGDDSGEEGPALVWLVVSGSLAVLVTGLLLAGASAHALWALVFGAAVVAARLLPYTVVDVPDRALLDLDRLAVTAWSARERPRAGRRRAMVRYDGVNRLVRRGQDLVAIGTLMVVTLAAGTGSLLLLPGAQDLRGYTSFATVGLGAIAFALVARSFRAALPRTALRLCAGVLLAVTGVAVLRAGDERALWVLFAAAAVVALTVVVAAVQLGRGWRSVWWARAADVTEGLSIVLVVALVPVASGLVEAVRVFVS